MGDRARVALCGTRSGYVRHRRRGEKACDACKRAAAEYGRRYHPTPEEARMRPLRERARSRAYADLARTYRREYVALYRRHLADAMREDEERS